MAMVARSAKSQGTGGRTPASGGSAAPRSAGGRRRVRGVGKIVNKELPPFARQFAAMLNAGMSVVLALDTLREQASPGFKVVLEDVRRSIEGGSTFSDSLQMYPDVFNELFINMVRAGERSGQFAETMKRIGELLEASARLKRKIKSAMTYPTVVLILALAIAWGLITFVVPVFAQMFKDFGGELPGPTRFLVALSNWMRGNIFYLAGGLAVAVFLFRRWKKTEQGAMTLDRMALKLPVFGVLIQKVGVARFARTLGQLIHSGVPILTALEIVSKATGNRVIGLAVMNAHKSVEQGDTISKGLEGDPCIPQVLSRMMAAGEKTGKLDEMLDNIANTFDDEVEAMLTALTSLIEPLLMVLLGVIVGGIVISMFLPIFKMGEIIGKGF